MHYVWLCKKELGLVVKYFTVPLYFWGFYRGKKSKNLQYDQICIAYMTPLFIFKSTTERHRLYYIPQA